MQSARPTAQRRYRLAVIGARSPSSGLAHATSKSLRLRQTSPPSIVTGTAPGAVLSTRTVVGTTHQGSRPHLRLAPPSAGCPRRVEAVSTVIEPRPFGQGPVVRSCMDENRPPAEPPPQSLAPPEPPRCPGPRIHLLPTAHPLSPRERVVLRDRHSGWAHVDDRRRRPERPDVVQPAARAVRRLVGSDAEHPLLDLRRSVDVVGVGQWPSGRLGFPGSGSRGLRGRS